MLPSALQDVIRKLSNPPSVLAGLSRNKATTDAFEAAGLTTVGLVREWAIKNQPPALKGIPLTRLPEIQRALDIYGVWNNKGSGVVVETCSAFIAEEGHRLGVTDGISEAFESVWAEPVEFRTSLGGVDKLRDLALEAYRHRERCIRIGIRFDLVVSGVGSLSATGHIIVHVDRMAETLHFWSGKSASTVLPNPLFLPNGHSARDVEVKMNFWNGEGVMTVLPPNEEAAVRYDDYMSRGFG